MHAARSYATVKLAGRDRNGPKRYVKVLGGGSNTPVAFDVASQFRSRSEEKDAKARFRRDVRGLPVL